MSDESTELLVTDRVKEKKEWTNRDNNEFYENVKADGLEKLAQLAGLISWCDLKIIKNYISNAKNIFEAGAGYGRVLDFLIDNNFNGEITAIDQCSNLFQFLQKRFSKYQNINLLHINIHNFYTKKPFDLILMLWSGIADYAPHEQISLLSKLKNLLSPGGKIIIDTLPKKVVPLHSKELIQDQTYKLEFNGSAIHAYSITIDEIQKNALKVGLRSLDNYVYCTDTNRERILQILA